MTPPDNIVQLVERFRRDYDAYHSPSYNEEQVRKEFLDPFFEALGWDVGHEEDTADAYKDVVHEGTIRVGDSPKAPDCTFRVGATRKFFMEAKSPLVHVQRDPRAAFQLRRYAWSAKLPLSILTNFKEFAVYDCRRRPDKEDKPSVARIHYWEYADYLRVWDEIAAIFSKPAVWRGDFDRYAEAVKGKRGTAEVDEEFLKEIESWREVLARNLALRNRKLSVRELNYAVAKTIDRLVFLRVCEDRGIEEYERLRSLHKQRDVYPKLFDLFHQADERYNSGLFHY